MKQGGQRAKHRDANPWRFFSKKIGQFGQIGHPLVPKGVFGALSSRGGRAGHLEKGPATASSFIRKGGHFPIGL
jgi:hypothetical protein